MDSGSIACFGECMVELRPVVNSPGMWQQGFAGDTCNTAVYLSRLLANDGPVIQWVSAVGDDVFSGDMRRFWRREALDDSLGRTIAGGTTGLYSISVDERGERRFSFWRSASAARGYFANVNEGETPLERSLDVLNGLHFSAIGLAILPSEHRARLLACAHAMRERGKWVSFDSNFRPTLWEDVASAQYWMRQALLACDRALVSIDDWRAMSGIEEDVRILDELRHADRRELILKRGEEDTWLSLHGGEVMVCPVEPVPQPVDTTAAGDAFAAAYLAGRIRGLSPVQAVAQGQALSRVVIMHPGAIIPIEHMPRLSVAAPIVHLDTV